MLSTWVSVIIAVVGLVVWFVSANPKVSEAGRIAFFCGLLAICLAWATHPVKLFGSAGGTDSAVRVASAGC